MLRKQDGTILPAWVYQLCPTINSVIFQYNKSFIAQAFSVKMSGYWPHFLGGGVYGPKLHLLHKYANKELGQFEAFLTSCLVNVHIFLA